MYGQTDPNKDSGYIERLIQAARQRLAMGCSVSDTIEAIEDRGVERGQAINVTIAAMILNESKENNEK